MLENMFLKFKIVPIRIELCRFRPNIGIHVKSVDGNSHLSIFLEKDPVDGYVLFDCTLQS